MNIQLIRKGILTAWIEKPKKLLKVYQTNLYVDQLTWEMLLSDNAFNLMKSV